MSTYSINQSDTLREAFGSTSRLHIRSLHVTELDDKLVMPVHEWTTLATVNRLLVRL